MHYLKVFSSHGVTSAQQCKKAMWRKTIYTLDVASFPVKHTQRSSGGSTINISTENIPTDKFNCEKVSFKHCFACQPESGGCACVCVSVWVMGVRCGMASVAQVVGFMLITFSCDFLAHTFRLLSCRVFVNAISLVASPAQKPNAIASVLDDVCCPCLCLFVSMHTVYMIRLKWPFVDKLVAMLKTPSRTAKHKWPIACAVWKSQIERNETKRS